MLRLPDGPATVSVGLEREYRCRQVTCRVRMRQVSAESAAVPDLRIRDRAGGFREEQRVLVDERIAQQVVVGGHRADHQAVAVLAHPAKLVDPA